MAIHNKRIEFTKEKLVNHYKRRDSLADIIYGLLRFLGIIVQNIYCVSSYLVLSWIILLPISWIRSDLYSKLENYLYNSLLFIVSSWSAAAGSSVIETGEEYKHLIEHYHLESKPSDIASLQNGTSAAKSIALKDQSNEMNRLRSDEETGLVLIPERASTTGDRSVPMPIETDSLLKGNLKSEDLNGTKKDTPKQTSKTDKNEDQLVQANSITKGIIHNGGQTTENSQDNWLLSDTRRDAEQSPRVLLLCNHISTADVPLLMQSFSTLTKQSLLWVLDAQFKPTNFGLVCSSHGDFFIAKNSFTDGTLRDQVLRHPDRNILVLFPEGGFWRKRLEGSNRYATKNGLPHTKYVTHPRFGAFKDLIDPSVNVTHIVDATLLYDDIRNPLSILDIAMGTRKEPTILNYKVYKRSEINPTEEWLRNLWLEKDKLLQRYYDNRESVYEQFNGTMRAVRLDWFKVLTVHLFYLLVCYLTVYRLFNATGLTMLRARDLYYSNI